MSENEKGKSSPYSYFVPFHLGDPAGIVFFGHLFTLAHQAFEHFILNQLECSWEFWFQNPEWAVPIKHAESQFYHPLRAGQECLIETSLVAFSSSTFTMTSIFYQSHIQVCSVKTVHIFCGRLNPQKIPIPEPLLKIFPSIIK